MAKIKDLLVNKNKTEKAEIKATEIVRVLPSEEYTDNILPNVRVKIESTSKIDGGVEVLAKGWIDGKQVGFGKDGSVEIERFRIYNPPILVSDPLGDHIRSYTEKIGLGDEVQKERRFREDPAEAIRQTIAHNISLIGKD